jgi:hypothetical protein
LTQCLISLDNLARRLLGLTVRRTCACDIRIRCRGFGVATRFVKLALPAGLFGIAKFVMRALQVGCRIALPASLIRLFDESLRTGYFSSGRRPLGSASSRKTTR